MAQSGTVGGAEARKPELRESLEETFAFTDDDFECYVQTIEDSLPPDEQRPWSKLLTLRTALKKAHTAKATTQLNKLENDIIKQFEEVRASKTRKTS